MIFAGLDAAGKTTIYKRTMEEIDPQALEKMRPTRGIERHDYSFLDVDWSVWDLGGQESYRKKYLSRPEIFNQTKALIFVVDLQDPDRYEEAYSYFEEILRILVNVTPPPRVYVLFHKFDPDKVAALRPDFYRATKIFRRADKILGKKFTGFATSIYSESISLAIRRILIENFPDIFTEASFKKKTTSTKTKQEETTAPEQDSKEASSTVAETAEKSLEEEKIKPKPELEKTGEEETKSTEESSVATTSTEPEETMIYEEVPDLGDLAKKIPERATQVLTERMNESPEIIGVAVLTKDGKMVIGVAKSSTDEKKLSKISKVLQGLDISVYFNELGDIEYRGLGHISLDELDIYFAKISDEYAMAVLAVDVSTMMLENAQRMVKTMRDLIKTGGMGTVSETTAPRKKFSKDDYLNDLKSRLKRINGFKEL